MANYIGYFKTRETKWLYSVRLITDSADTGFTEVKLAGDSPFVVTYNESSTPFDPVRTSTATIKVVNDDYLEDVYSPYAHGTRVTLYNEDLGGEEWVGFLVPKIYSQGYEDCNETIEIEAADCVSSLQYFNYEPINGTKSIVSVKSILDYIGVKCELLNRYYWTRSKYHNGNVVVPEHLSLSEQNFFSSDTDEPWKLSEVLEEICRYFGFTAFQYKQQLYFIDYEYLSTNENLQVSSYPLPPTGGSSTTQMAYPFTIKKSTYRGNGADISFEPIYNKITVRDNFYFAEDPIPDIFADQYLINRVDPCDFYANYEISAETPYQPTYTKVNTSTGSESTVTEAVSDKNYRYFQRPYNHKYWESLYYTSAGTATALTREIRASSACTRNYAGATIMDLTVAKDPTYRYSSHSNQWEVPSKKNTTRYICIAQKKLVHGDGSGPAVFNKPVFRLKDGVKSLCPFSQDAYLVIYYKALFEKYANRAYINPDWTTDGAYFTGRTSYAEYSSQMAQMAFRFQIGNKWWKQQLSGSTVISGWTSESTASTEYNQWGIINHTFKYPKETGEGVSNTEATIVNNVSWQDDMGVEGWKIPLSGVSMTGDIIIEVFIPSYQFKKGTGVTTANYNYNEYAWISDLKFYIVEPGQGSEQSTGDDVVYENVIDTDAVNELSEITLKLTTKPDYTKPAYSNVVYTGSRLGPIMLDTISEPSLSGVAQKPEENIIEKYVKQYSTPTKKIQATQQLALLWPFVKIYGADVDNPNDAYVMLGGSIDYSLERQTITMIQLK